MSESSKANGAAPQQHNRLFIIILMAVFILLGLGYVGGFFILPGMVKSAFQNSDCETVLAREDVYSRVYPAMIRNKDISGPVRECAVYALAIRNEETEEWRDSYDAFHVYSETYPNGLFINDAHEHGAVALMGLAKEEMSQEKYSEAVGNINALLDGYSDTAIASDAETLKSELHMALAVDLREAGNFVGAEQVFKEINAWAQDNNETEYVRSSQLELAQTYLAWALELQSQENFAEAKAKFDTAISTDPDSSSGSGPSAQAKASLADLYTQWGDYLIAQKDFANAMQLYKTAAMFSENDDPSAANDMIANGYVQWAVESINGEDFLGALVLLDFAQESGNSDTTKTLVDDTRSDLFLTFSKSDGEQAQKAIDNAVRIVCEHHIQPSLPIFGLDDENILAGVHGTGDQLPPESIAATTPASLHYVACIEEDTKVSGTLTLPISNTQFGGSPGVTQITYANFQYFWNVVLKDVESGKEVETTIIEGIKPADLIPFNIDIPTFNYFGAKPDIADLADWILTVIK